jgi:tellurite resistance protein TerC
VHEFVPWLALGAALSIMLAVDLLVVRGRGGEISTRGAVLASVIWLAVGVGFAAVLLAFGSDEQAGDYLAGYLVERSLSLDNVFVFLLVFGAFAVAPADRHRLLTYGVLGALLLRGVFIVLGVAALERFSWLSVTFAALLLATAAKIWAHRHDSEGETALVGSIHDRIPLKGTAAALAALMVVDVIFAVDSVPAILAITTDTYVVFAANAFALLGLRPLFVVVADLVERLYYLKAALAVLLAFIAIKMAASEWVGKLGPEYSLPAIAAILGAGVAASLLRERRAASEGRRAVVQRPVEDL